MTQVDNAEWIEALHHTEKLLTTFLTDWNAGLDLLMAMPVDANMTHVVGVLLGFIRSDVHDHLRHNPNLTLDQILTDIRIGFLDQRAELDT